MVESARTQTERAYLESREDVYYYLLRLGLPPGEAQETAQEVFLRLFKVLSDGQEIENHRAWAFRVAHNLGLNVRERERKVVPLLVDQRRESRNPERIYLDNERQERMEQAVAELSPQQRQCLHLRAEGLRYHEIAATLGVSVSTVNEFVRRAVRNLKKVVHA
ncbi:MAG: sigma-70 family RNA polymerase sigma factor [Bryobacteraceae bacterium]|nr:sigma-70 family RNA polymerase sigma factor [Bryobacteraceae bacterium]